MIIMHIPLVQIARPQLDGDKMIPASREKTKIPCLRMRHTAPCTNCDGHNNISVYAPAY